MPFYKALTHKLVVIAVVDEAFDSVSRSNAAVEDSAVNLYAHGQTRALSDGYTPLSRHMEKERTVLITKKTIKDRSLLLSFAFA